MFICLFVSNSEIDGDKYWTVTISSKREQIVIANRLDFLSGTCNVLLMLGLSSGHESKKHRSRAVADPGGSGPGQPPLVPQKG